MKWAVNLHTSPWIWLINAAEAWEEVGSLAAKVSQGHRLEYSWSNPRPNKEYMEQW